MSLEVFNFALALRLGSGLIRGVADKAEVRSDFQEDTRPYLCIGSNSARLYMISGTYTEASIKVRAGRLQLTACAELFKKKKPRSVHCSI